jgi:TetR/AcrR family transcriptional regulator
MSSETESKIIEAARKVFHRRGFHGTRTQDIADEAGINKAMLHYYFRTKDQLFQAVFREALLNIFPQIIKILNGDEPLEEKIEKFVHEYIDLLMAHPYLPGFVLHEITANPEGLKKLITAELHFTPEKFLMQYQKGVNEGLYVDMAPQQFLTSLLGVCVFPFIARPMIQIFFGINDDAFGEFIEQRKKEATMFIINGMKRKTQSQGEPQ